MWDIGIYDISIKMPGYSIRNSIGTPAKLAGMRGARYAGSMLPGS